VTGLVQDGSVGDELDAITQIALAEARKQHPDALVYRTEIVSPDGRRPGGPYITPRRFEVGAFVNLPTDESGRGHPGKGYIWRVVEVDDDEPMLALEFVRPYTPADADSGQSG
jgi:hypothetical protein